MPGNDWFHLVGEYPKCSNIFTCLVHSSSIENVILTEGQKPTQNKEAQKRANDSTASLFSISEKKNGPKQHKLGFSTNHRNLILSGVIIN
ncbi:hypothetical protein MKW98_015031 [Papaver atlanticum]|uniref:Uncharacterized protein n=1 Tax=Papaver atlanticum TaxID=357466 RepID=A0AAD4X968_9MAGN|nr:hypothetical protein MKW98_015031 [Papaver atlanticum]